MQFTVSRLRYEKMINEIGAANATDALRAFVKSCANEKQKVANLNVTQINKIFELLTEEAAPFAVYGAEKDGETVTLKVNEEIEHEVEELETVIEFVVDYAIFEKFQNRSGSSNKVLAIKNLLLDTVKAEYKDALKMLMQAHPVNLIASPVIEQMGYAGKISLVA